MTAGSGQQKKNKHLNSEQRGNEKHFHFKALGCKRPNTLRTNKVEG
jgi:hypothetical protein